MAARDAQRRQQASAPWGRRGGCPARSPRGARRQASCTSTKPRSRPCAVTATAHTASRSAGRSASTRRAAVAGRRHRRPGAARRPRRLQQQRNALERGRDDLAFAAHHPHLRAARTQVDRQDAAHEGIVARSRRRWKAAAWSLDRPAIPVRAPRPRRRVARRARRDRRSPSRRAGRRAVRPRSSDSQCTGSPARRIAPESGWQPMHGTVSGAQQQPRARPRQPRRTDRPDRRPTMGARLPPAPRPTRRRDRLPRRLEPARAPQHPVGYPARHEPRLPDAIAAAELERALAEPDPPARDHRPRRRLGEHVHARPGRHPPRRDARCRADGAPTSPTRCRLSTHCAPQSGRSWARCCRRG